MIPVKKLIPGLGMVTCLLIGWLIGRSSPNTNLAETQTTQDSRPQRPSRPTTSESRSQSTARQLHDEIRRSSPDQLAALMRRALLITDHLEQREAVTEICRRIDASNWLEVYEMFALVTKETGITNKDWEFARMMCVRNVGQVVVDHWLENDRDDNLSQSLWYWAQDDPALAKTWLEQSDLESPGLRKRLLHVLVGGTVQNNPDEGIAMMKSLTQQERSEILGHFVWNLKQAGSLDSVIKWAAQTTRSPDEDLGFAGQAVNAALNEVVNNANNTGSGAAAGKHLARMLTAAPQYLDLTISSLYRMNGETAFQALESLASAQGTPEQTIDQIVGLVAKSRQGQAMVWVNTHPDSPLTEKLKRSLGSE